MAVLKTQQPRLLFFPFLINIFQMMKIHCSFIFLVALIQSLTSAQRCQLSPAAGPVDLTFVPSGIVVDPNDFSVYFSDQFRNSIMRYTANGTLTTFAGGVEAGYIDGPDNVARFNRP